MNKRAFINGFVKEAIDFKLPPMDLSGAPKESYGFKTNNLPNSYQIKAYPGRMPKVDSNSLNISAHGGGGFYSKDDAVPLLPDEQPRTGIMDISPSEIFDMKQGNNKPEPKFFPYRNFNLKEVAKEIGPNTNNIHNVTLHACNPLERYCPNDNLETPEEQIDRYNSAYQLDPYLDNRLLSGVEQTSKEPEELPAIPGITPTVKNKLTFRAETPESVAKYFPAVTNINMTPPGYVFTEPTPLLNQGGLLTEGLKKLNDIRNQKKLNLLLKDSPEILNNKDYFKGAIGNIDAESQVWRDAQRNGLGKLRVTDLYNYRKLPDGSWTNRGPVHLPLE